MSDHDQHIPSKDANKATAKPAGTSSTDHASYTRGQGRRAKDEAKAAKDKR